MGAGLAFRLVAAVIFATVLLAFVALPRPCVCVWEWERIHFVVFFLLFVVVLTAQLLAH